MREHSLAVWVDGGEALAVIVTADDPYSVATYAAQELVYYVKLATAVEIPVRNESGNIPSVKHRIYIGQSDAARKAGIDHEPETRSAGVMMMTPLRLPISASLQIKTTTGLGYRLFI